MSADSPELLPRAWWSLNKDGKSYHGTELCISTLRDCLARQTTPFDVRTLNILLLSRYLTLTRTMHKGVFGFSQGAGVAAFAIYMVRSVLSLSLSLGNPDLNRLC